MPFHPALYTTDSANQLAYLVNDSATTFLIVENDEQLDKFLEVRDQMPTLIKVVVLDKEGLRDFTDDQVLFLDDVYALGKKALEAEPDRFEAEIDACRPDDVRMLIYTSGTTGKPKGAMITHANIMFQINSVYQMVKTEEGGRITVFSALVSCRGAPVFCRNPACSRKHGQFCRKSGNRL